MKNIWRTALTLVLLLMVSTPASLLTTYAQDDDSSDSEVVVVGSNYIYMQELFDTIVNGYQESSGDETNFRIEAEGPDAGFQQLCAGSADIVLATSPITDEQILACDEAGINFVEVVMAVEGLVLAANEDSGLTCLSIDTLPTIFLGSDAPTWNELDPTASEDAIAVYGPAETDAAMVILRGLLGEQGFIPNFEIYDAPDTAIEALQAPDNNALAFMTLETWEGMEDTGNAQLVSLNSLDTPECTAPTSGTFSAGTYPASRMMMFYVNAASLSKPAVEGLLLFALGEGETPAEERPVAGIVTEVGFTIPSQAIYDRDLNNVRGPNVGRTFSRGDSPVTVNTAIEGEVAIDGASMAGYATSEIYGTFNQEFANVQVARSAFGDDTAWTAFCAGEVSVIQVSRPPTDGETEACASNGIDAYEVFLGAQAVVFMVQADSELPMCLTYDEIGQILVQGVGEIPEIEAASDEDTPAADETEAGDEDTADETSDDSETESAGDDEDATADETEASDEDAADETSDETVDESANDEDATEAEGEETEAAPFPLDPTLLQGPTRWNQINPEWPDLPLLVLVPSLSALETDIVMGAAVPGGSLRRTDAPIVQETPDNTVLSDIDYRLGGTANFDGAITYMFWDDYAASAGRDAVHLMEVDAGDGCVMPDEDTILDSSYPFGFSSRLVFSEQALGDPLVAALLWHTHSRAALDAVEALDLISFDRDMLETERDNLFGMIEAAQAAAASAAAAAEAEAEAETEDTQDSDETESNDETSEDDAEAGTDEDSSEEDSAETGDETDGDTAGDDTE